MKIIMKIKFTILLIVFGFITDSYSQNENIIGKWKVKSVDNGEFYMNIENDSIALTDIIKETYNDSIKLSKFRDIAYQIYFKQTFSFLENGKYIHDYGFGKLVYSYKIDNKRKIIITSENDFADNNGTIEMPFKIENDVLYIEIPVTEPSVKLKLKK